MAALFGNYNPYMDSKYGVKPSKFQFWNDGVGDNSSRIQELKTGVSKGQYAGALKAGLTGFSESVTGTQNAGISEMQAQSLEGMGNQAAIRSHKESGQVIGNQIASQGASGLQMSGSALDALNESYRESEYDAYLKKQAYTVEASAKKIQGMRDKVSSVSGLLSGFAGAAQAMSSSNA